MPPLSRIGFWIGLRLELNGRGIAGALRKMVLHFQYLGASITSFAETQQTPKMDNKR